jgi:hypothetical protein
MICNSNSWSRFSGKREEEERRGDEVAGRGRGDVLLGMACQIDHLGSLKEDVSAC